MPAIESFELLKEIYQIDKISFETRIAELAKLLDVERLLKKQIRKLSLGERMKMELIGAIIHDPEILFLDEPTIGLDIISKRNMREFLRKIQQEKNITIILTSHDMDDVEKVCDRVIIINEGQKVFDDSMERLTSKFVDKKVVKFIFEKTPPRAVLENYGKLIDISDFDCKFEINASSLAALLNRITTDFNILDIDILPTPLEEIIEGIFNTPASISPS